MDGDGLALSLHLLHELFEQAVVFSVADAKSAPLFLQKQLLGAGQHRVLEVQLEGTAVGITV